eukprot:1972868-Prymnesium_polylepis.1
MRRVGPAAAMTYRHVPGYSQAEPLRSRTGRGTNTVPCPGPLHSDRVSWDMSLLPPNPSTTTHNTSFYCLSHGHGSVFNPITRPTEVHGRSCGGRATSRGGKRIEPVAPAAVWRCHRQPPRAGATQPQRPGRLGVAWVAPYTLPLHATPAWHGHVRKRPKRRPQLPPQASTLSCTLP